MENKRRFVSTTDEEIEQKRLKMNAQKTIKQNIAAATLLSEYLKEKTFVTLDFHIWLCLLSLFLGMEFSTGQLYQGYHDTKASITD
jgi:hypothetical protein